MIYNISPFGKEGCYNVWYEQTGNIDLICDIDNLNIKEDSQDVILSSFAISLVSDPLKYLSSLRRFLNPKKGQLYILTWDWEFIARQYLASEIKCGELNILFKDMKWMFDRNHIVELMQQTGYREFVEFYDKCQYFPEQNSNEVLIMAKK